MPRVIFPLAIAACVHLGAATAWAQTPRAFDPDAHDAAPCGLAPDGATVPEAVGHLRRCMEAVAADARRFVALHDAMVGALVADEPEAALRRLREVSRDTVPEPKETR